MSQYAATLKDGDGNIVYPITLAPYIFDETGGETVQDKLDAFETNLNTKAPSASPSLTGTPTAPTATTGTNTTQIATTEFVRNQIGATGYAASSSAGGAATNVDASNVNNTQMYVACVSGAGSQNIKYNSAIYIAANNVLMGAAWNDYAEKRRCMHNVKPGTCLIETGKGDLIPSDGKLQRGAHILSDTFGMAIGPEGACYIPVAVAGRVLATPFKDNYKVGDVVCSGPRGTIQKMNRLEIILFPDRIIGIVSEIPSYETWNGVEVRGRIWIKLK